MSKLTSDNLIKVEIWWLKKIGFLRGYKSGTISWTYGLSGNSSRIRLIVSTLGEDPYVRFRYTQTSYDGKRNTFDYKAPLTTTRCHFGGVRYWFTCPFKRNGIYCGRRVGVLYKAGDYFGCRYCYNLTYESRNVSGWYKMFGRIISFHELEQLEEEVKRTHYNGKVTRKYRRYLRKKEKANTTYLGSLLVLQEKATKGKGRLFK